MRSSAFPWVTFVVCLTASVASGQWFETTIAVPDTLGYLYDPHQILDNPVTGRVYVAEDGSVLVFDPVVRERARLFRMWGQEYYWARLVACPERGKMYLLADTVRVIDASTDTLLRTAALPFWPDEAAYSRASGKLYLVPSEASDSMSVFDVLGDTLVEPIAVSGFKRSPVWDSAQNRVYVGAAGDSAWVVVIDCSSDSVLVSLHTELSSVDELDLALPEQKLYCRGRNDSLNTDVTLVFDTDSLQVGGMVQGLPGVRKTVYNHVVNRLYCIGHESLYVVDCEADTVRTRLFVGNLEDLDFNFLNGRAYVLSSFPEHIAVVDTSDSIVVRIPVFVETCGPLVLGFSARHNELYCGMELDLVFIIDADADTLAGSMDYTHYDIRCMVHNPAGNKLYALSPADQMIHVIDASNRVTDTIPVRTDDSDAFPILNPSLNRLYVVDDYWLWVIDCNSDEVVDSVPVPGIVEAICVLHQDLNKLYVFPENSATSAVWVYDCLSDSVVDSVPASSQVPCAVYHSRSGKVYFCTRTPSTVNVLDPQADSVVKTIYVGAPDDDLRMLADTDLGMLYVTNQSLDRLYTIDVSSDSLVDSDELSVACDTLVWNRRLGKVYACESREAIDVFDCRTRSMVRTVPAYYRNDLAMNPRNDKLYLPDYENGVGILDCRYDSVVSVLEFPLSYARAVAWNQVDNRVYLARREVIAVYKDEPSWVEETLGRVPGFGLELVGNPVVNQAGFLCRVPEGQEAVLVVRDAAGRSVYRRVLSGNELPVAVTWRCQDQQGRPVGAGVYFAQVETPVGRSLSQKVVVQR